MMSISRVQSLVGNIKLLDPLLGGKMPALLYLVKSRGDNHSVTHGVYRNIGFQFRRGDIPAVREVLAAGEYKFLEPVLRKNPTPVVYDIGAHIGTFAIWALSVNPQTQIVSIEASPGTYKILAANSEKAASKGLSWRAMNRAAWGREGEVEFQDDMNSTMSHRAASAGTKKIPAITLAQLLSEQPGVDLMKIDIEGAEEEFLKDAGAGLKNIKNLVIEVHPSYCDAEKVIKILKDSFSIVEEIQDRPRSKPLLFCRN